MCCKFSSLNIADMMAKPPGNTGKRSARKPCKRMRDALPARISSLHNFCKPSWVIPCADKPFCSSTSMIALAVPEDPITSSQPVSR